MNGTTLPRTNCAWKLELFRAPPEPWFSLAVKEPAPEVKDTKAEQRLLS